jgi:hypothetical protein
LLGWNGFNTIRLSQTRQSGADLIQLIHQWQPNFQNRLKLRLDIHQWLVIIAVVAFCQSAAAQQASPVPAITVNAPSVAIAPETLSTSGERLSASFVPEFKPDKPAPVKTETGTSRRSWLILSIAASSAAAFDGYSTHRAIEAGGVEANPLISPFARSEAIYPALQTTPLFLDFVGRRLQRSHNGLAHRLWWLPQTISAVVSIGSGIHDLQHVAHP